MKMIRTRRVLLQQQQTNKQTNIKQTNKQTNKHQTNKQTNKQTNDNFCEKKNLDGCIEGSEEFNYC
jgi:hypothetical protein